MEGKSCPKCERGRLSEVDNIKSKIKGHIFIENGWRCRHCKAEFIKESDSQQTIEKARILRVW